MEQVIFKHRLFLSQEAAQEVRLGLIPEVNLLMWRHLSFPGTTQE
jgi:hypothetical protein